MRERWVEYKIVKLFNNIPSLRKAHFGETKEHNKFQQARAGERSRKFDGFCFAGVRGWAEGLILIILHRVVSHGKRMSTTGDGDK